ncbi:MAG TPA: sigma 54-interacting transcriptional regulator, partial [Syntrophomonas sp.]|nr:sigma 54-interacting transcriptional regulator [Syntrophomonas sp.]
MIKNPTEKVNLTKEQFVLMLDNIFGNVFVADGKGKVIFLNENSASGMGFTRDELLGKTIYELLEEGITKRSPTNEALIKGEVVTGFAQNRRDGLVTISTPVFDDDGNIIMVVTYSQEIPLMDTCMETVNKERQENIKYKQALEYLGTAKIKNSIVVENNTMIKIFKTIDSVAKTDSTVVIYGESGVGKEVVTSFIHKHSRRSKEPLIPVNCAAIPRELMESEFFGYARGAFTGANKEGKPGLFELANNGTLFLDEIAELPLDMQAKLLRVLETGEIKRIGSTEAAKKMDVRIIAATNKNLHEMVSEKSFREDLFYRLNVIPIHIPPLRERTDEIPLLANAFLNEFNRKYSLDKKFSEELMSDFSSYQWPGNIRELKNVIERLVITSSSDLLTHFDGIKSKANVDGGDTKMNSAFDSGQDGDHSKNLKDAMNSFEEKYIGHVLKECNGNVSEASKRLKIHRSVLYKKIKNHGSDCGVKN